MPGGSRPLDFSSGLSIIPNIIIRKATPMNSNGYGSIRLLWTDHCNRRIEDPSGWLTDQYKAQEMRHYCPFLR